MEAVGVIWIVGRVVAGIGVAFGICVSGIVVVCADAIIC